MNILRAQFLAGDALSISRRRFLHTTVLVGGVLVALPRSALATPPVRAIEPKVTQPVISFHMDQPYVDYSGTAEPYIPPAGVRSAHAIAELDDETVFATLRL